VKASSRPRRILHLDLDPFFVSVEQSLDPGLRGRPLIVGGGETAIVAAASVEARASGVHPGLSFAAAQALCPEAIFRPGDLETYARFSNEVTDLLLSVSRRVERPSADEAYVDLTADSPGTPGAVASAELIKDEVQRRLGLTASLGLASSRLAARVASSWARPRGLLVVLPGYEASYLSPQPISFLPELPPHLEALLKDSGLSTLGEVAEASEDLLASIAGPLAGPRLRAAARGEAEAPIEVAAPPSWIVEETSIRARGSDREVLLDLITGMVGRACRRLRPFSLGTGGVTIEVRRGQNTQRRTEQVEPVLDDEATIRKLACGLAGPLLDPPASVRGLQLRLGRLSKTDSQPRLFFEPPEFRRAR